jgi:hypothetical protein
MALDVWAARNPECELTDEDVQAFRDAKIKLWPGGFGDGVTSFGGSEYDTLVTIVTGVSLYKKWIPPETVKKMADLLNRHSADQLVDIWNKAVGEDLSLEEDELASLQRFFDICAKRGLGLVGAW